MRSRARRSRSRQQQSGTSNNDFGKECTEVFGNWGGTEGRGEEKKMPILQQRRGSQKKIIWDLANLHSGCKENKTDAVQSLAAR